MAHFIKLHPHYLMLVRDQPDTFAGKLSFSVEQYGLVVHNFVFDLQLTPPNEHYEHWRFICEEPAQLNVPNFVLFLKSIEHYIFMTLKFSPIEAVAAAEVPKKGIMKVFSSKKEPFRLFFKDMFFDIHSNGLEQKDE
jgi:L-rhamnose mutarotase